MSVKIYNGFRLKGIKSLDKAFVEMQTLRPIIQQAAQVETSKMLAGLATKFYDDVSLYEKPLGDSALMSALDNVTAALKESAAERAASPYDLSFSLTLGVTSDRHVIGILFCTNRPLCKLFRSLPLYEEYGYWNNTDRPEGVTLRRWNKRSDDWEEVLPTGIPSESMFSIEFVPEYSVGFPQRELVQQHIPTFEYRLQRALEAYTMSNVVAEFGFTTASEMAKFRSTGDRYQNRLELYRPFVTERLKQDLTAEILLEKI